MLEGLSKPTDIAQAAESLYKKLVIADKYQAQKKFNGNVTFIKAKDNFVQLGEDYGLKEVTFGASFMLTAKGRKESSVLIIV